MTEETKDKIREMSQADIPISQRRALYNQMDRRMKRGHLKPGLVEKYQQCLGNSKERWNLLREFLIDENMLESQPMGFWNKIWCTYYYMYPIAVVSTSYPRSEVEVEGYFVQ